jgi:hypothetical protein
VEDTAITKEIATIQARRFQRDVAVVIISSEEMNPKLRR